MSSTDAEKQIKMGGRRCGVVIAKALVVVLTCTIGVFFGQQVGVEILVARAAACPEVRARALPAERPLVPEFGRITRALGS